MVNSLYTKEEIFDFLSSIADPEIPVVSIQEIGMLRDVIINNTGCEIVITPTYTGCPAMGIIEEDIKKLLHEKGISNVKVKLVYAPAWTSDWINEKAKEKMKKYGIAPPLHTTCSKNFGLERIYCPLCNSANIELVSQFGATACKALYKCSGCKNPFEHFKCH